MANKTFLQLQDALASMWGYSVADLAGTQDLIDLKGYINASVFDCYAPVDGKRAMWPEEHHSGVLKAPVTTALGLTNGSKVVTGYVFEDTYAGSFVKIGDVFYRYSVAVVSAGPVTTYYLVQPWAGTTGSHAATIYHNAYALPWTVIELAGVPNLMGVGLLAPLPDADAELCLRSAPAYDFIPKNGLSAFASTRRTFPQTAYFGEGDPRFYHIDQASVAQTFAVGNRIHFYPLPDENYTFELRANIVPLEMTEDAEVPLMPARAVDNILLPIAREKLAKNTSNRRYTGPNVSFLIDEANRARSQLDSLRRTQRVVPATVGLKRGW